MNNNSEGIERLAVTIEETCRITSESKSAVYNHLASGTYTGVKSGRRTLILYASIKKRFDNLPRVQLQRKPRKARGAV